MAETPRTVHLIAIGGTGMAPLACLLQDRGHRVQGSDGPLYPPMSTLLAEAGIEPRVGFDPEHLDPPPDLVVVGNAVPRDNPQARAVEERGIPRLSMPEAVARFFLRDRRPLVVAGTHGKTTTTAMAAWVWSRCGRDPGYLIGGLPQDLPRSFHDGRGDRFIIEGDEYNASYFDRGPKFLHYRPQTLILTSVEYDHADLYPDPADLENAYRQLVRGLPDDGLLVAFGDAPAVRRVAEEAPCEVVFYGLDEDRDGGDLVRATHVEAGPEGLRCRVEDPEAGSVELTLAVPGEHNLWNALAVWAAARRDGLPAAAVAEALGSFHGVARRLQVLGTQRGVTVVDDFAHHPTAVGKSLEALAQRFPDRRVVALFEPRSLTAGRSFFEQAYRDAFRPAHRVLLAPIFHAGRLEDDDRLDLPALAADLIAAGVPTTVCDSTDEVLETALAEAREGDVLVTMSSGSFDGLPRRLLAGLEG